MQIQRTNCGIIQRFAFCSVLKLATGNVHEPQFKADRKPRIGSSEMIGKERGCPLAGVHGEVQCMAQMCCKWWPSRSAEKMLHTRKLTCKHQMDLIACKSPLPPTIICIHLTMCSPLFPANDLALIVILRRTL